MLSFSPIEITLLVLFIFYLTFNIETPIVIAEVIESPFGLLTLSVLLMFLFFYGNPIIAVLFVFVAYELLKRSSMTTGRTAIAEHTPSQKKKDVQMKMMTPKTDSSLEEEIVNKMAPIGKGELPQIIAASFKPLASNMQGASKVN
jgi:hypothetical protein